MLNNDAELTKCQKLLGELEAQSNEESQRAKITNFKQKILDFKSQTKLVTHPPKSMYNLVLRLKELNEELFTKSVIDKSDCTLTLMHGEFLKIKADLEKEIFSLEEQHMHIIDLNTFKVHILNPIERFYQHLVGDMDSMHEMSKSYVYVSNKIEAWLKEANSKLANIKDGKLLKDQESNVDAVEKKSNDLKDLKLHLSCDQMKSDLDLMQKTEIQLNTHHRRSKFNVLTDMKCLNFDSLKIKYLDLACQIDHELKLLENEGSSFRTVSFNTQKMLDIIKQSYRLLAGKTLCFFTLFLYRLSHHERKM